MHRRHAEAERRAQDGDVLLSGLGLDGRECIVLRGPQVFVDSASAGAMVFAGEGGWQRRQQFAQRRADALRQRAAASGRERKRARAPRIVEPVDVNPICRLGRVRRDLGDVRPDRGALAARCRSEYENVEAVGLHAEAEVDGLEGPVLTDQTPRRLEVRGRLEAELVGLDRLAQIGGGKSVRLCPAEQGWNGRGRNRLGDGVAPAAGCAPSLFAATGAGGCLSLVSRLKNMRTAPS